MSWEEAADCNGDAVAGYNVYRGTDPSALLMKVNAAPIAATEYVDSSLPSATTTAPSGCWPP